MKRLYLIIFMALAAITGFAQQPQTGDYIYVYEKNGETLSFLREEIRQMAYIYEDTLGVTHEEVTSQAIILDDIAYIIPLADIDSISFVTPATVYQPGVIRIEEGLMDYVERIDSLTIYFAANTPQNLLPKVGDKLVSLEINDKFDAGFAGRVASVSGTTVVCDAVELGEVFETYYETTVTEGRPENKQAARTRDIDFNKDMTFDFPTYSLNFGQELTANVIPLSSLAIKGGIKLEASITPQVRIKVSLIVNKNQGTNFNGSVDFSASFKESVGLYGGLEKSSQFGWEVFKQPVCKFIKFYFKPGVFMDKSVEASITNQWEQTCGLGFSFSFTEKAKDPFKFNILNHEPTATYDLVGCVDGRLAAGLFTEVGLAPNIPIFGTKLLNIALHSEFGAEIIGHAVLYNEEIKNATKETKTYEKLKASNIQINSFVQHEVQKHALTVDLVGPVASVSQTLAQWDLVPKFTNLNTERKDDVVNVSFDVEKSKYGLVTPVDFGVAIYNSDNEMVASDYLGNFWKGSDGGTFTNFFKDLNRNEEYVVSPIVKVLGFELRSSLSAKIDKEDFPVRIVSFEQTGSGYSSKQEYEYEGRKYFYKFNATTTVEINPDTKKVKDWGYVYHDIYGVDKKISCANLGSNPYPDARYAYYYNERSRTVSLTPYIQYEGETDIKRGKEKIYQVEYVYSGMSSCPDEHHPHAIDLGLPSGTLWACCNVGAEEPEEFGTYYQSGNPGNGMPAFQSNDDTYEFTGTMFDPATVEWGVEWATPSSDQMEELVEYSTYENKYEMLVIDGSRFIFPKEPGGDAYVKVYGPNGNYILMPAAGIKNADGTYKDKNQPAYQYQDGALRGDWLYNGGYWTDYNDGEFVLYLSFSQVFFPDRNLQKNQENEVSFDVVASKDLMQAMPIRPVINKNQGE